ncbi:MAG: DNA polymerase III subunit chi [Kangiellaceae bacterium]|jgi:DNA polymerase-3 subunit chi|nr:DNA polymerase III subunit chi [Kangiellaceae bacterium]
MTQIDFYILEDEKPRAAFRYAVDLIQSAYASKKKVFVHTNSQRDAEFIDELLWTQEPNSFLPHLIVGEADGIKPPIQIGFGQEPSIRPDVLINLSNEVPRFHGQFERLIEFAHGDDETKQLARERFKHYRDRGYPLRHHNR